MKVTGIDKFRGAGHCATGGQDKWRKKAVQAKRKEAATKIQQKGSKLKQRRWQRS